MNEGGRISRSKMASGLTYALFSFHAKHPLYAVARIAFLGVVILFQNRENISYLNISSLDRANTCNLKKQFVSLQRVRRQCIYVPGCKLGKRKWSPVVYPHLTFELFDAILLRLANLLELQNTCLPMRRQNGRRRMSHE